MKWKWDCPVCGEGDIETDDCDTEKGGKEIIEYYTGHCLACGRRFKWRCYYNFVDMSDFEED